jgi:hypothetical protein
MRMVYSENLTNVANRAVTFLGRHCMGWLNAFSA